MKNLLLSLKSEINFILNRIKRIVLFKIRKNPQLPLPWGWTANITNVNIPIKK
jgi:hypothetical protein